MNIKNILAGAVLANLWGVQAFADHQVNIVFGASADGSSPGAAEYLFTEENSEISQSASRPGELIVNIYPYDYSEPGWQILIRTADYQDLMTASYLNAKTPFADGSPAVVVEQLGEYGCNDGSYGRFDVLSMKQSPSGFIEGINFYFEQTCLNRESSVKTTGSVNFGMEPAVGFSVSGVEPYFFGCNNKSTGQQLKIKSTDLTFDCRNSGLDIHPGDEIFMTILSKYK